ncbi:hypothetical protein BC938DRAFT_473237, partial [Jimgerdemannia flammicorona]
MTEDDERAGDAANDEIGYDTAGETANTSRQNLPYLPDQQDFDWERDDDNFNDKGFHWEESSPSKLRLFLARFFSSHPVVVTCIMVLAVGVVLAAILVAMHYIFDPNPPVIVVHAQVWVIWAGFAWMIGWITHGFVEAVPWIIKRLTLIVKPHKSEFVKMRMAYYNALRSPIKTLLIAAWIWGCWGILISIYNLADSNYADVFIHVLECVFLGSVILFVEKFLLQLIVTRFHTLMTTALRAMIESSKHAFSNYTQYQDSHLVCTTHSIRNALALDRMKKGLRRGQHTPEILTRLRRKLNTKTPETPPKCSSPTLSPRHSSENFNTVTGLGDLGLQQLSTPVLSPAAETHPDSFSDNERPRIATNIRFSNQYATAISIQGTPTPESRQRNNVIPTPEFIEKLTSRLNRFSVQSPSTAPYLQRGALLRSNTVISEVDPLQNSGASISRANTIRSTIYPFQPSNSTGAQAKRLAKKIFNNLLPTNATRDYLLVSDLYPFFDTHGEAQKAFAIFDMDMNNEMTKQELKQGVVRIYRERKNLATSLRDLSQAAGKLDTIFLTMFALIWIIICCAVFSLNVLSELIPLWTLFLALSFVFGSSAKDLFESIIFVFVT